MPRHYLKEPLTQLREEFSTVWTLLNDTSRYLKRASLFQEYEAMLRMWRAGLQKRYTDPESYRKIKRQIIGLRRQLRTEGHDLRLGKYDIVFSGFKSDNAPTYGFRRAVIYLSKSEFSYIAGDENHGDLLRYLERRLGTQFRMNYIYVHNIWFRWRDGSILEIAGADSETRKSYESLVSFVEENRMYALKKMSSIR
ncbi:MAG: hypothetical protein ACOCWH_01285 [Spirochaetota bacterium]